MSKKKFDQAGTRTQDLLAYIPHLRAALAIRCKRDVLTTTLPDQFIDRRTLIA